MLIAAWTLLTVGVAGDGWTNTSREYALGMRCATVIAIYKEKDEDDGQ